ncbi:hypothetical protein M8J77_012471 [Diaphorina citri]|nr:hypothetical protein M8J77_012471 [Diaphorina citri]
MLKHRNEKVEMKEKDMEAPTQSLLDKSPPRSAPPPARGGFLGWCKANSFLLCTLFGVILGIFFGITLRGANVSPDALVLIGFPGEIFMRTLQLLILPFIISCIIVGVSTLDLRKNSKVAVRTLLYFLFSATTSSLIGVISVSLIRPGEITLANKNGTNHSAAPPASKLTMMDGFLDMGRNLVPNNIFQATFQQTYTDYVEHNGTLKRVLKQRDGTATLGIIFFCIVFGAILGTLGPKKKTVLEFFQTVYTIMLKILLIAIWMTPIGVCSVITSKLISIEDMTVTMRQLSKFVATSIGGFLVYHLIVIQLIYFLFTRKNPYKYYVNFFPAILTAFATSSKSAALPITFQVMDEKVKMSQQVTRFVLPIGNSIHMTGLAQFIPICVIFIAQMRGMDVTLGLTMNIWIASIFMSMSVAGVPSAGIIMVIMLCVAVGVPTEDVSLLFAVDWLVDRVRTTVNLMGDCYAVAVVDHLSRHELQDSVDDYDEEAQKTSDL